MRSNSPVMRQDASLAKERLVQGIALALLLLMGAFVIAGPSGLIAWTENQHQLEERRTKLAELRVTRDHLKNRVGLLDQNHVDPDLAGELLRSNLNVVRPDEMVMMLDK
ncbi:MULTISPECIES: septum formation initiator family protein [Novosphingobium]|uniref:Septum formation initiator n=1 Tax=Novosphingobium pentaromativorans TaxID=205844 RepID=A0A2W5NPU5_9SPHN|nr:MULTISPECIES: septum formation initiator family protein [Novosphingobium]PZQ54964.1 MAG: septum formation initiator [Novosphingobium pentaromativorans]